MRVRSQVDGVVTQVLVTEGQVVRAGEPLALLANPELVHLAEQAEERLQDARARERVAAADAEISALDRTTSVSESELDYRAADIGVDISTAEGVRIVENDQAKNMAFSRTDVERSRSDLDRSLNWLKQAELRYAATQARGAAIALNLAKTERERERMEELQSKSFASTSSVEAAQLSHANAMTRSEEYKTDLAGREADMKAAADRVASARKILAIWQDALGHGMTSFDGMSESRESIVTRSEQMMARTGVRLEANRTGVDLQAEKSGHIVQAAAAGVRAAEAALRAAEQQVAWLRIVAPSEGVVTGLSIASGELVRSAKTALDPGPPLLTLAAHERLVARARVDGAQLARVAPGAPVLVASSSDASNSVSGEVMGVAASDGHAGAYVVTVSLPEAADGMPLGSVVQIEFR
ncbi:HlyD family efflux transporter periplasmic adaptor subunit [Candidatus Poribacteria bacterium]|nr:HlyD family efflux transporter periplasmic adaptor subunit [Candidatus Poribacteria bacterium]MBT5711646.1 HlyD family efflux transporter periplasmic adaptor subunit [Candidatus Poribacteria bacterium]MBT7101463.1 HlyD family efflux transporter periplasmic adaptor subunit [Candidatus Poribacteria bacterium]MBT7809164.1 HlyD family efflux transporter periplasmic adaptor subunit [Candidatus Poribacteria bacterium]